MKAICALVFALAAAPAALAQAYSPPRTPDGRPDLQGVWASVSITTVERPRGVTALVPSQEQADAIIKEFWDGAPDLDDPDIAYANVRTLSTVRGELRTSHLIQPADGKLPFTKAAAAISEANNDSSKGRNNDPEERPLYERCLAGIGHPPFRTFPLLIPMQVVQTQDQLVLWTEDVAGLRTVHIGGKAPSPVFTSYEGWSSARWEGDTLVIETTHLRPDNPLRSDFGRPIVLEPDSRIIEKLTLLSDDELLYQFTVEDPDIYTQPWLAEFSFRRQHTPVYEYACHEANYSIVNVLQAGRMAELRAKSSKAPAKAGKK